MCMCAISISFLILNVMKTHSAFYAFLRIELGFGLLNRSDPKSSRRDSKMMCQWIAANRSLQFNNAAVYACKRTAHSADTLREVCVISLNHTRRDIEVDSWLDLDELLLHRICIRSKIKDETFESSAIALKATIVNRGNANYENPKIPRNCVIPARDNSHKSNLGF